MRTKSLSTIIFFISLVIYILLGTLAMYLIFSSAMSKNKIRTSGVKVTATISDIVSKTTSKGDSYFTAYVTYEANGTLYENIRVSPYSSDMYTGEQLTIFYSKDDPTAIALDESYLSLLKIPILVAACFILLPLTVIIGYRCLMSKKSKKGERLKQTGQMIIATIEEINTNRSINIMGKSPTKLHCKYVDDAGQLHLFTSKAVYDNSLYSLNVGDSVNVYVDPSDYSVYFVDIESAIYYKNSFGFQ